jgi:hypothetical protein
MGFIRTSMAVIVSTLLFISLIFLSVFSVLSWSSSHYVLKNQVNSYSQDLILNGGNVIDFNLDQTILEMQENCITQTNYIINEGDIHVEVPCNVVNNGKDAVINYIVNDVFEQIYYKNYSCDFLKCLQTQKDPFVLVSEKSHLFVRSLLYTFLIISIILFLLLILLVKKKSNSLIITGILIIIVSLIIKGVDFILVLFSQPLLKGIISLFFSKSHSVFLIFLIIGCLLFFIGILIKVLKLEIKIAEKFSKKDKKTTSENSVRKIVRDEIKEEMKNNKKNQKKKSK